MFCSKHLVLVLFFFHDASADYVCNLNKIIVDSGSCAFDLIAEYSDSTPNFIWCGGNQGASWCPQSDNRRFIELGDNEKVLKIEGIDFDASEQNLDGQGGWQCYGANYLAHRVVVTTNLQTFQSSGSWAASATVWTIENPDGLCEFEINGAGATTTLTDKSAVAANVCTCENGTPTSATGAGGELCETDEDEDCFTCDEGFDLSETAAAGTLSTCTLAPEQPDGACFHGDGTVLLESGVPKRFSNLGLGDVIQTSDGQGHFAFNPVLALPHKMNNSEAAAFLTLTTETGKMVDMTSDHFIPKCNVQEVTAGELVVGDCVLTVDGKETLKEITSTAKSGVFTAITQDKFIVVGGFVASAFSKDSDPGMPELDYKKYRLELKLKHERKLAKQMKKNAQGAHASIFRGSVY